MTEPPPDAGAGVNSIETKLDSLIATVDQRFEAVDRRFDGVERRLDRVEIAVEDIRDQVKLIAEGHAATQALIHRKFDEVVARLTGSDPL